MGLWPVASGRTGTILKAVARLRKPPKHFQRNTKLRLYADDPRRLAPALCSLPLCEQE